MSTPVLLDYYQEYLELQPSLFRESDNLHLLFQSVFHAYDLQQQDFLWLSQNVLNIDLAEKSHLDFIGMLVGQPRFLVGFNTETRFGFEYAYKSETFGSAIDPAIGGYWNSRSYFDTAAAKRLDDETYRRVIKARIIYNSSDCIMDDLVSVVNTLVGNTDSTVQRKGHGVLNIKTSDPESIIDYFYSRIELDDNILPVPAGVRVVLENTTSEDNDLAVYAITDALAKLVNEDLPKVD